MTRGAADPLAVPTAWAGAVPVDPGAVDPGAVDPGAVDPLPADGAVLVTVLVVGCANSACARVRA